MVNVDLVMMLVVGIICMIKCDISYLKMSYSRIKKVGKGIFEVGKFLVD